MRLTSRFHRTSENVTNVKKPRHPLVSFIILLCDFFGLPPYAALCSSHASGSKFDIFSILYIITFFVVAIAFISLIINVVGLIKFNIESKDARQKMALKNKNRKNTLTPEQVYRIQYKLFRAFADRIDGIDGIDGNPHCYDNPYNIKKEGKFRKFFKISNLFGS